MARRKNHPDWANPDMTPKVPWTPEEELVLKEISEIGLTSYCWSSALPNRAFGDIVERRLTLKEAGFLRVAPTI